MRKWIKTPFMAALLGVTLISGCGKEQNPNVEAGEPKKLFDYSDSGMRWDDTIEFDMDEFPELKFIWSSANLTLNENGRESILFSGMPIWSVYFCDLNGDGKREIISGISVGSGIVDQRIIVCDLANDKLYTLSDRFSYDFAPLINVDGVMCYSKIASNTYPDPPGEAVIEPLTMSVLTEKTDNSVW